VIADEIKELMNAEPFRPVRIVLGDQQAFVVAFKLAKPSIRSCRDFAVLVLEASRRAGTLRACRAASLGLHLTRISARTGASSARSDML
jgi:hypothetical protein